MAYKIVSFDFDHTLSRGISAMEHFASKHGIEKEISELEHSFKQGLISTDEFSKLSAKYFAGLSRADLASFMEDIPLLRGVHQCIERLIEIGLFVIINTVGYRPLLLAFCEKLDVHGISGADVSFDGQIYTGEVRSFFKIEDKVEFAERFASSKGFGLSDVIAVGDGLSDMPLFEVAGYSIALNADRYVSSLVDYSMQTQEVLSLMEHIEEITKGTTLNGNK